MPRKPKGPRLWLRKSWNDRGVRREAVWFILDGARHIATGCAARETVQAEQKLAEYIAQKYQPARKERDIEEILIADVLSIYLDDRVPLQARPECARDRVRRLNEFWGALRLTDVNGATCRAYVEWSGSTGGSRRDLEDLRAAINHHSKEGLHRGIVRVTLPQKGNPRDRWLTRNEAAALIRACWNAREIQTQHRGQLKGRKIVTDKRPSQHIARFILIALYTGTRASAVAAASPYRSEGRSYVDLDQGLFYRLAEGSRATKKRQPPVPLPPRLLAHMRRWVGKKIAKQHFVEWNDKPVLSVTTGFRTAVRRAGLTGKVTPHTLRHTAATWLMQAGVPMWQASRFLGMTQETLESVYGHHHPEHLREAAAAIGLQPRQSLAESLAGNRTVHSTPSQSIEKIGGPAWTRTRNQT
ncbi:MAG: site-specific integrase, partial [Nitrospira sp.]|nr:site-specific integrase [Nitrospira sp.]